METGKAEIIWWKPYSANSLVENQLLEILAWIIGHISPSRMKSYFFLCSSLISTGGSIFQFVALKSAQSHSIWNLHH